MSHFQTKQHHHTGHWLCHVVYDHWSSLAAIKPFNHTMNITFEPIKQNSHLIFRLIVWHSEAVGDFHRTFITGT